MLIEKKLSSLLVEKIETKTDLKRWYALANSVEQLLLEQATEVPHLVWHFLCDADIRLKDPSYGEEQIIAVRSFIEQLNCWLSLVSTYANGSYEIIAIEIGVVNAKPIIYLQ